MAKLEPGVDDYVRACRASCGGLSSSERTKYPLHKQREWYLALFRAFPIPRPPGIVTRDEFIAMPDYEIPLRIYRDRDAGAREACIIYAHGGGFVSGTFEAADSIAADLAARLGVTVVTFQYRRAPEHRHPAAIEDCYQTVLHVIRHAVSFGVDPSRVIFSGESCGGSFAAGVAMWARDHDGPPLLGHVPVNPVFDLHRWARREVHDCSVDYQEEMHHYTSSYLGGRYDVLPSYASPLLASDFSRLPPAFVWAAGEDPLRLEALAYGDKLRAAGVPVKVHIHDGVVHGCQRGRNHYKFAAEAFEVLCKGFEWILQH